MISENAFDDICQFEGTDSRKDYLLDIKKSMNGYCRNA